MSTSIVPERLFFVGVLVIALALFLAFVTGKVNVEELPDNEIFENTFKFHGETAPEIIEFLERLEEELEHEDCTDKLRDGEV